MDRVLTGLDRFVDGYWKDLKGYRLGLLANQASLNGNLATAKDVISGLLPGHLKALFGPQHGYGGEVQDNMIETDHAYDERIKIPIFSLYGKSRELLQDMTELFDVLIIDLQDVGTRVYTFAATLLNCVKAAARDGKKVIVFDRPNPLGGEIIEGNLLKSELYSFVGPYRLPMRHGLTLGEMAQVFNEVFNLGCNLEIITMSDWSRKMTWDKTGLRWHMPSPNMPFPETAYVYPGQVFWEGTNLSEGRGTCRPFEIIGAPYINPDVVEKALEPEAKLGCHFQPYTFMPTFNKWEGEICKGFMIHVTDLELYRPFFTSLALLKGIIKTHKKDFKWKQPPYEYEYEKKPIDLIIGDSSIRKEIETGTNVTVLQEKWNFELTDYRQWIKPFLLYP